MNKFGSARAWEWKQEEKAAIDVKTECALLLYTESRACVYLNRKRHALTGSHMLYVQPQTNVSIEPAGKECTVVGLFFRSYRLQEQGTDTLLYRLDYSKLPNNGFVLKPLPSSVPTLVRKLLRLSGASGPYDESACDRAVDELVQLILKQMNANKQKSRVSGQQAVEETMQAILQRCELDWNRDDVAEDKRFNSSHLSRAFKQQSGYSFSAFLIKVRLNRAKLLLLSTDLTLDSIAHEVGFLSGLYLSRRFKRDCGLSPSDYRAQMREKFPTRIAAMHQAGNLLALGIQPIAASLAPWNTAAVLHKELLEGGTFPFFELEDLERMAELRPELILIPEYTLLQNARKLQQLERIAPVLFFPSFRVDPIAQLRQLAGIVGRKAEAERWIADFLRQGKLWKQNLLKRIPSSETAALYELRGRNHVIVWPLGFRGSCNLYRTLKVHPPSSVQRDALDRDTELVIPLERLPVYAADHMFVLIDDSEDRYERLYDQLSEHPVWTALEAYRKGRIYRLPLSAFWSEDALTLERQLPLLAEAVDEAFRLESSPAQS